MEKLTEISIKSKYISVLPDGKLLREVSYGGSQEWVRPRDDKGKKLELGRWQKLKKPNVIADCGCGLVASEDVLTYLEKKEMPAGRGEFDYNVTAYQSMLMDADFHDFPVLPYGGLSGILMALNMNRIFRQKGMKYKARWINNPKKMFARMQEMLEADIPVIFSAGPGIFKKKKFIRLFVEDGNFKNGKRFKKSVSFRNHYVTCTGILTWRDASGKEKRMLRVSSWGRKYYLDFDEYYNYVESTDNWLFSNMLYIRKK